MDEQKAKEFYTGLALQILHKEESQGYPIILDSYIKERLLIAKEAYEGMDVRRGLSDITIRVYTMAGAMADILAHLDPDLGTMYVDTSNCITFKSKDGVVNGVELSKLNQIRRSIAEKVVKKSTMFVGSFFQGG
tara:strand:- start:78528 stop:78929 length:402 start_codon:yes stop_codon:yes gene_type:complete